MLLRYFSRLFCALHLALLAVVSAEIGLSIQSDDKDIDGKPIRLVNGYLSVGGEGPMFQGDFDSGALVLSDRVVAQEAAGSGIGVDDNGLLIVTFNSTSKFYDRQGWLEYNGAALFGLKQIGRDYQVYVNRPDLTDKSPVFIEVADMEYPSET